MAVVAAIITTAAPTPAQAQESPPLVDWHVDVPVTDLTYHPASAGGSTADMAVLWANGSATVTVDVPAPATHLLFEAWADRCEGVGPVVEVRVDGELLLAHQVLDNNDRVRAREAYIQPVGEREWSSRWWAAGTYAVRGEWGAGRHHVSFRFTNDRLTGSCDRNLKLARIRFLGPDEDGGGTLPVHLRQGVLPDLGEVRPRRAGPPGGGLLWSPGTLRYVVDSYRAEVLELGLWRLCGVVGMEPEWVEWSIAVRVDGEPIPAPERAFHWPGLRLTYAEAFGRPGSWADGPHVIEVELLDDSRCDSHLGIEHIRFFGTL